MSNEAISNAAPVEETELDPLLVPSLVRREKYKRRSRRIGERETVDEGGGQGWREE